MTKITTKPDNPAKVYTDITPIEFERVLNLYGMQHIRYAELRSKSPSWFYKVLRTKKYLSAIDIKALTDAIGEEVFENLINKVRGIENESV